MNRYFLTRVQVEGFRGINNEGDPLDIRFRPDAVNSIFAANGLGKSSLFESLSFALSGSVPKLDRMATAESAKDYYCNRFHSQGRAEIVLTLTPDDGAVDVVIKVTREVDGTRLVTSPSGCPDPELLLSALNDETVLLDHHTFTKFLLDSPFDRGKSFSALLGLAKLADVRQALSAVSDTMAFNTDFGTKVLETEIKNAQAEQLQTRLTLKQDYLSLVGTPLVEPFDRIDVAKQAVDALASVSLLTTLCENHTLGAIDFKAVSDTIKTAEKSDEQDRLKQVISSINGLKGLAAPAPENASQSDMIDLCRSREQALSATRGSSFRDLYAAVRHVYDDGSWTDQDTCPACEAKPGVPPYTFVSTQLHQFQLVDDAEAKITSAWQTAAWGRRLQRLEAVLVPSEKAVDNLHAQLNSSMATGQTSVPDLEAAVARLKDLEAERTSRILALETEQTAIEGTLPPSLVTLIEQVERAKRIKSALDRLEKLSTTENTSAAKLNARKRWKAFIEAACETFEDAEARLAEKLTAAMAKQYKAMYLKIAGGSHIIPAVQQKKGSIDLNLRLEQFFGLKNTSATPLLSESYRNAIAISIFLCAALQRKPTARFIVLDDVTSSFDAGHQFGLMEVLRTEVGLPLNKDGLQVILFSHDGLLEKYFDKLGNTKEWHHQHLQGLPPNGVVLVRAQEAERLKKSAELLLQAGQGKQAEPLIRQHLEFRLLQIISKVGIPVPMDFAIKDHQKMVSNCLDAINSSLALHKAASQLVLTTQQQADIDGVHVPALIANWISHYETGVTSSFDPYVLLGVLHSCEAFADCFQFNCSCKQQPGKTIKRYYRSLSSKGCSC